MTQESRRGPARRPPPRPPRLRRRKLEHEERAALGARRHHLLAHLSEERRDGERAPLDDRDVLLAVDGIRHRRRADAGAGHELPQRLSVFASSALNQPWMSPWKRSPLAVVVMPPMYGRVSLLPQTFCCLIGSPAMTSPRWPPGPHLPSSNSTPR